MRGPGQALIALIALVWLLAACARDQGESRTGDRMLLPPGPTPVAQASAPPSEPPAAGPAATAAPAAEEADEDTFVVDDYGEVEGTARVVLDGPASRPAQGVVRVSGWAADPDAADGTGVDEVWLWLIEEWPVTVTPLGRARYGLPRPEAAAALGRPGPVPAGFSFDWDVAASGVPPGTYFLVAGARQGSRWSTTEVRVQVPASGSPPASAAGRAADDPEVTVAGVAFRLRQTAAAALYYTEGVSAERVERAARTIDEAARRVPALLGLERPSEQIDLYLFANRSRFLDDTTTMGFEWRYLPDAFAGFYEESKSRLTGIYVNASLLRSDADAMSIIAHEYVHHAIDVASRSRPPDVWLNEGLADYVAYLLTRPLDPDGQHAEVQGQLATLVRAQRDGSLLSFAAMRSYTVMIGRGEGAYDKVHAIYAAGAIAVATLVQRYGLETVAAAAANGADRRWWFFAFPREIQGELKQFEEEALGGVRGRLPSVLPAQAPAGRSVTFVADGFKPFEPLTLEVTQPDGARYTIPVDLADEAGVVLGGFRPPRSSPAGVWTVRIQGAVNAGTAISFTVERPAAR